VPPRHGSARPGQDRAYNFAMTTAGTPDDT
jgi:hypothetical protein